MINTAGKSKLLKVVALILAFVCPAGAATITIALDQPVAIAQPGDFAVFSGKITNTGLEAAYLNGALGSMPYLDLLVDYNSFFTVVPPSLGAGEVYSGEIFGVSVGILTGAGDYFGSFSIQGGADGFSFEELGGQNFQISVSTVPEPGSGWLVFGGLAYAAFSAVSRQRSAPTGRRVNGS